MQCAFGPHSKEACILVRKTDIRWLTLVMWVLCWRNLCREHSAIPGVRGNFLEAEMSQLRTTRHKAGIRSGGREHSSRRKGGERVRHVQVTSSLVWNARDYRGKDAAGARGGPVDCSRGSLVGD